MTIDATLYETAMGDSLITVPGEYTSAELEDATLIADLELLASFDHSLRTADETAFVIGCECGAQLLHALLWAPVPQPSLSGLHRSMERYVERWHQLHRRRLGR